MKTIPLSMGMVAVIDDEDFNSVSQFKWTLQKPRNSKTGYAYRNEYVGGPLKCVRTIRLHRFIVNAPTGMEVDHIDGNGLNNCRSNLRICTHAQNMMNMTRDKIGYKGVSLIKGKRVNPWRASIMVSGKQKHIGFFTNSLDAAIAYNVMAVYHFGEFAKLNNL